MGSGGTPLTSKREYYNGGTIPWLQSGEVAQGEVRTATNFITQAGFENSAARIFPRDTVLVAMYGATAGQVGILRFEASTNQAICGILPNEKLHPKFLYYALLSKKSELISKAVGNAQPNISQVKIKNTCVPVPPLAEQKRIVAILDEAFEGIDTAIANAEKNLANAREMFESYLEAVFTVEHRNWIDNNLISITTKIGSGATPRGGDESYKPEGISLIRSLNIHDLEFKYRKLAFIDESQADELSNVKVQQNDVLLNITGASVARCCVVPDGILPARVNQHVAIIRPIVTKVDPQFLHYLLISKPYKDRLLKVSEAAGATRQALTKTQLQEFTVRIPKTVKEQEALVRQLNIILEQSKALENVYQNKLAALSELKQAILKKALSGELDVQPKKAVHKAAE
jgi:type I restriction enzyme S subunit